MSLKEFQLSYEDMLQCIISPGRISLDDPVLSNGKLTLTPRALLASYPTDIERDRILFTLSFNIAKGHDVKGCVVALLKLAAQEGKLKVKEERS